MTILPALHTVITGFVRRTWLVTLVAMFVCAVFAARAVAAFVEADQITLPGAPPRAPVVKPAPTAARIDPDVLAVRNIFCSSCMPVEKPGPTSTFSGQPAVLIATSLGGPDARATVRVIPTEVQGSWGIGETIPGVGHIARISGGSIEVVDDAGRSKELTLLEPAAAGRGTGAATPEHGPAADPFNGRIKKLGDASYEVDRELVRELIASAGQNAGMRAMPILENGEIKGLRLFGIKPTSAAAAIGLKNSDVLSGIDGDQIKTANQMLELLSKLEKLPSVELQGTRAGKPLAVSLRFR